MSETHHMICNWLEDPEGYWMGDCGVYWQCIGDGPEENGMRYCPRCGGEIRIVIVDDQVPQELRYDGGGARKPAKGPEIVFSQDLFADLDERVAIVGERFRSLARVLPVGTARDMALSGISEVGALQKALQAGELTPA